ncbi:transposase [Chitinispirillales bacterium ANBcel5]|uniref:transposase n=1 Tax=Cellulosispirillum alkaliphilum TaxID=3039283 RepID=UPI002A5078D7|nr:transposase [Chitinispirillales bacterium ANBcel5]
MSQSLTKLYTHIVFSTKNRVPFLADKMLRYQFHDYIGGVLRTLDTVPLVVGGVDDHIHILCVTSKNNAISKLVGETKRISSMWIKSRDVIYSSFYWQRGYSAFSVGRTEIDKTRNYISSQETHHQNDSFEDEYLRLLDENEMNYDLRYVWD